MKRKLVPVITIIIVAVALYLGAQFFFGKRVEGELQGIAQELIDSDQVQVRRFEYERGLASGTLHYDLLLMPIDPEQAVTPGSTSMVLGGQLTALLMLLPEEGLPLQGELPVSHGPWLGSAGLGVAKTEWAPALPDELRNSLPQYPGQAPVATVVASLGFSGGSKVDIRTVDYNGRFIEPGGDEEAELTLSGLHASGNISRDLDSIRAAFDLDELTLAMTQTPVPFAITLQNLNSRASWNPLTDDGELPPHPFFWTGSTQQSLQRVSINAEGREFHLEGLQSSDSTEETDGVLSKNTTGTIDRIRLMNTDIDNIELAMSMDGLSRNAFMQLLEQIQVSGGDLSEEAANEVLQQALAANPRLALDRLSLAVNNPDDVLLTASFQVDGAETLEDVPAAIMMDSELTVAIDAIRQVVRTVIESDGRGNLSEPRLDEQTDVAMAEITENLRVISGLEITDQHIRASASIREGELIVGEQPMFNLLDLIADAGPGGAAGNASNFEEVVPDIEAAPRYERVELASGFAPAPYTIALTAGGPDSLDYAQLEGAPLCTGYINAAQPDAVLDYSAGTDSLYIHLDADDDTTLAIYAPDGNWYCNDDADGLGLSAGLSFDSPQSGEYIIWAGAYYAGEADATLNVSEEAWEMTAGDAVSTQVVVPDVDAEPLYERIELASGFTPDPYTLQLSAGGTDSLDYAELEGASLCTGYINAAQPDAVLNYSAGEDSLHIYAGSEDDTTLAIYAPDGSWYCNDDADGLDLNGGLSFDNPQSGEYIIWIGTYYSDVVDATLNISEVSLGN